MSTTQQITQDDNKLVPFKDDGSTKVDAARLEELVGIDKLSKLQETILMMLLRPDMGKTQQKFNRKMYEMWFPRRKNVLNARATLSRTYRRLEDRDLIFKYKRRWLLTEKGEVVALALFAETKDRVEQAKGNG